MMSGFLTNLKGWYNQPFTAGMSVTGWALFLGVLIVILILWTRVLNHIDAEL